MLRKSRSFIKFLDIVIYLLDFINLRCNFKFLFILKRNLLTFKADVIFIDERKNWAVTWIGKYLTENLKKLRSINAEIASPIMAKNQIIHWGAISYLIKVGFSYLNKNSNIVNWYHLENNDKRIKIIPILNEKLDFVVTPSTITKDILIKSGMSKEKVMLIPLGVDLKHFKKFNEKKKNLLKKKFNLPFDKIIIGSFQKDGVGWSEGLEPKLIKGPDIFCEVVKKLNDNFKIHIFLTGPTRGYIKKKLEEYKIPYTYVFLDNYLDIVECYNILDLYIISSRIEGGPQSLLESMATGVPIVTTNVGMAPYLIENGINGFKTQIENIEELYKYSAELIENKKLRENIISNAFKTVKKYSWENVTEQYYNKIYKKLL